MVVDNERIKIINKIANLLAKADSTQYEAEAESARKLAAKLMTNYEVKSAELNFNEKIVKQKIKSGNVRKNMKHAILFNVICKYCGVYMVMEANRPFYILVGKDKDIEASIYMSEVIWKQIVDKTESWYKVNKKKGYTAKDKNSYTYGLIYGVEYNLDKINKGVFDYKKEMGLVPVNENVNDFNKAKEQYNNEHTVKNSKTNIRCGESYNNGFNDSESINIRNGVNSNTNKNVMIGY